MNILYILYNTVVQLLHFSTEKMEKKMYLFAFCSPLSSILDRSLSRGPHENFKIELKYYNCESCKC